MNDVGIFISAKVLLGVLGSGGFLAVVTPFLLSRRKGRGEVVRTEEWTRIRASNNNRLADHDKRIRALEIQRANDSAVLQATAKTVEKIWERLNKIPIQ